MSVLDLTRQACSHAAWGAGQRVMDIGCGSGSSVTYLRELGVSAFGVDLSVAHGQAVFQGRAECLPLASGSLEGILAECSLSAMPDREGAIAECARVLAPGGTLVISDLYARATGGVGGGESPKEEWWERVRAQGFEIGLWEDHSEVLTQLLFRMIMEQKCGNDAMEQIGKWKKVRPGYFLLIAELPKRK